MRSMAERKWNMRITVLASMSIVIWIIITINTVPFVLNILYMTTYNNDGPDPVGVAALIIALVIVVMVLAFLVL